MPKQPAKKVITSKKSIPAVAPAKALPVKKPAATVAKPTPVAVPPPAPAKNVKPAARVAAVAPAKAAPIAPAKAAPVAAKAPVAAVKASAAPKSKPATASVTTIVVNYDAGFGNLLFLRGEGTGLAWDKGVQMENLTSDEWVYTIEGASSPLAVKVLLNDMLWSSGANVEVPAGQKTVIAPIF